MKRKIYIKLIGGLGNQLFQYSCAKNLSMELHADLIIDDKSGFFFDWKFKRKKALPSNLKYKRISFLDLLWFNFLLIIKKVFYKKKIFLKFKNQLFIDETIERKYIKNFFKITKNYDKIFLIGFFQSEKYFFQNKKIIVSEILKNKIKHNNIKKIAKLISKKTVCIGIRLFEEAPKNIKYSFGGIENFSFYNKSINIFKKKVKKPIFYIFSTNKNNYQIKTKIKTEAKYIDKFKNNNNDFDILLLISHFSNFVISNSTYYWWGAYLANYKKNIKIVVSKKFPNINTIPNTWKKHIN